MIGLRSRSAARAAAAGALYRFRLVHGGALGLQGAMALAALVVPLRAAGWLGFEVSADSGGWIRAWAGLMLLAGCLQLPGLVDPVGARGGLAIAIAGRLGLMAVYLSLGGAFLWLAAFEGLAALATGLALQVAIRAEIMTRP
jgi:hypothetical protein